MDESRDLLNGILSEYNNMSPEEKQRFECFRRTALPKDQIKKIMQGVTNSSVHDKLAITMSGVSKMFLGEIIERAVENHYNAEMEGPLHPDEILEAYRQLLREGRFPQMLASNRTSPSKVPFRNVRIEADFVTPDG